MDNVENKQQEKSPQSFGGTKLIILIVLSIVLLLLYLTIAKPALEKFKANPITQQVLAIKDQVMAMDTMTKSQIENQARSITAKELIADPQGWTGQYVVVTGQVSNEESATVDANLARNMFSDSNWKGYILNEGVVLLDMTGEGDVFPDGGTLKGYGKVFFLRVQDIWEFPVFGPDLEKEFANIEGMENEVVFFISKGVDLVDMVEEDTGEANPCGDNPCDENPCGENPCGENPCEENPCGENPCGENPCG